MSQIKQANIPASCMQQLTTHDTRRARGLTSRTDWLPRAWRDEIEEQVTLGAKCELEALISSRGFGNVADFIHTAIARADYLA